MIPGVHGAPWWYSVIPSTQNFPTEYQIHRHGNPAGLPTFAAIWGPDFRASIIRLTCPTCLNTDKTHYYYFDDDVQSQSRSTKWSTLICMQRRGTRGSVGCLFCAWLHGSCCVLWRCDSWLPKLIIAMKSAVSFPTELKLARHHAWKTLVLLLRTGGTTYNIPKESSFLMSLAFVYCF